MIGLTQNGDFDFDKILSQLSGEFKREVTTKVAQHSLLFFKVQFQKQGTDKDGFVKWKERKLKVNRKMLVETGYLRDSMKITSQRFERVKIAITAPYAEYHQNGTDTLPQREMVYESNKLNKQVESIIKKELDKIFKR
ncbi:phage gpG-like protein [Pontibacter aydingkolensis]|uniref:Phage protein, HK97 gp10 family n=1 Tax=Pontibacter aydingkolensis TaxID=1911536 RepID=A0ABS7CQT0_9BACT|nr:hypothetical protein [Pontibacter aydingkolensis]MBW7466190.1 hypothetical protein [Pontibacter aydingkolensis]